MGATVTGDGHERQQRKTSLGRRAVGSLLRIVVGVPIVSLFAASALLLVFGTTSRGKTAGIGGALLGAALFCIVGYWNEPWFRKRGRISCVGLVAISLLFYLILVILAPNGGSPHGRIRNCYLNRQERFTRYAPANVIPEVDQLGIGITLLPLRDPHARSEARTMRSVLLPMYAALDQDDDFHALGSAMGLAYRELFHVPFRTGHYYAVVPDTDDNERLPCLIFLHGMGGNMKPYIWVLSGLNSRVRCVVLAPTFGIGNWDKPGGAELVVGIAREAVATLPVDKERIFLLGYSNGAMGVTRAVIQEPALFRGLVYLSPVTEDNLFQSP